MATTLSVNLITTCRGRLEHIKRSVPLMLKQLGGWERWVTVVDYGDPEDSFDWCQRQAHPMLHAIKVLEGADFYSHGRARNFGAVRSSADIICLLDADCLLKNNWLANVMAAFEAGADLCLPREVVGNYSGQVAVRSRPFHAVRGYDESFAGWGFDDTDLYQRLDRPGTRTARFDMDLLDMIEHGNELRVRNYQDSDATVSWAKNYRRAADSCRGQVNQAGYGVGRCLYWRTPQTCARPVSSS
jgi:hypothetical protein